MPAGRDKSDSTVGAEEKMRIRFIFIKGPLIAFTVAGHTVTQPLPSQLRQASEPEPPETQVKPPESCRVEP